MEGVNSPVNILNTGNYNVSNLKCGVSTETPSTAVTVSESLGSSFSTSKSSVHSNVTAHNKFGNHGTGNNTNSPKLNVLFNRFSPVLKGNWTTYRRKYMEGPIVGRGSFGVVKTLFSMVDLLELQQLLPTKLRLPANRLSEGIKALPNGDYEFCGLPLRRPTRAAKIMNLNHIKKVSGAKNTLHVLRELAIGAWNDHPNIVKVKEIYIDGVEDLSNITAESLSSTAIKNISCSGARVYIVMEYCSGGDLTSRTIPEAEKEDTVARMFLHVFRALSYINSRGIAHRDVKPENFLWSDTSPNAEVKLADFGLANSTLRPLKTRAGTAFYVAPEIVKCGPNSTYSVKCDSWSAGIMLHVFLLGSCPFHSDSDAKTLAKVVNEEIDWTHERYAAIPPEAYDLLKKLLVKSPHKRISTTNCLKHHWFTRITGEISSIPMSVEEATGIVQNLSIFYRFPILKQLALCLMIRQIPEAKIQEWRDRYLYLGSFCEDDSSNINLDTIRNWLLTAMDVMHSTRKDGNIIIGNSVVCLESQTCTCNNCKPRRRTSLRRTILWKSVTELASILNTFSDHNVSISFTEFLAAQLAESLCQKDDLITDIFAGLHSDIPGRRCLFIDTHDLRRLVNPMYKCCDDVLEDVLKEAETSALTCYMDNVCDDDDFQMRRSGFIRNIVHSSTNSTAHNLSLDEFFVMMKYANVQSTQNFKKHTRDELGSKHLSIRNYLALGKSTEACINETKKKKKRKKM
ncbi:protein kinase domain containing protein [Theileria equi strain WA]|uniref:Protein kinase domain containing protein n=1 Tax=Theileria equi strain WA TaxID=1537102 RepID=L0AVX7_THEEQ|nr:protein kinase domain containing protein [Theileria equi strain WA]AFZ79049.1 protein kinase domain containing protein [Theileria equi strain WA]|eukprot:XP_004828715.1 protein kinase domain containing protein [Theileria equi strain WA]